MDYADESHRRIQKLLASMNGTQPQFKRLELVSIKLHGLYEGKLQAFSYWPQPP